MITNVQNVGYCVYGDTLGELWLDMVETILKNGIFELDENRGRFAVRNLRFAAGSTDPNDKLIEKYGDKSKIDAMKRVVFESDTVEDFDITPSFRNGAKSYKKRLEEGHMVEFVVERLAKIPESKKRLWCFQLTKTTKLFCLVLGMIIFLAFTHYNSALTRAKKQTFLI
jgi:hypothetical protein